MWLHSGLFQMCLFAAYCVKYINNIEIDSDSLYKRKTEFFKDINKVSSLLHKYYLLQSQYAGDNVESDFEDNLVVKEFNDILKDTIISSEEKNNEKPQEVLEINWNENRITSRMKNYQFLKQQILENLENSYDGLPKTWSKTNEKFSHPLTSVSLLTNLIPFLKGLFDDKYTILIYNYGGRKMDKLMQTVLKKYYVPYISYFILKPDSTKSQLVLSNYADVVSTKYVEENHEYVQTLNNLEKIENVTDNHNLDNVKGELSHDTYNETLRTGCIECTRVQLRKCYKALKIAIKNACRIVNCIRGIKKTFQLNAKLACLYVYSDAKKDDIKCEDITKSNKSMLIFSSYFKDKTRGSGNASRNSISLPEVNLRDDRQESPFNLLNILRDKYEKACDKTLYKKCINACFCAIKITCAEEFCVKKKIKKLIKHCKIQCKAQFVKEKDSSEDSSDCD